MAIMTVAFCGHCQWRSSPQPGAVPSAGLACPECSSPISDMQYDPTYAATLMFGQKYVEAAAVAALLTSHGIATTAPATNVALPGPLILPTGSLSL